MRRGLSLGAHLTGLDPGRARGRFHQRRLAVGKDAIQIHGLPSRACPFEPVTPFVQRHPLHGFFMVAVAAPDRLPRPKVILARVVVSPWCTGVGAPGHWVWPGLFGWPVVPPDMFGGQPH